MYNLNYPPVMTYFIAYDDLDSIGYGSNDINQCTTSGADNFEQFTDINLYTARLLELGIIL